VAAEAALAERAEQIAQGAVAQKIDRLVGDLEARRPLLALAHAARPLTPLPLRLGIRRGRDVAVLLHPLHDLLDQLFEPLLRLGVRLVAEQLLQRVLRQHAAAQQGFQNRVVERLHRAFVLRPGEVRIVEAAREQQIGQLRHELVHVEVIQGRWGVLAVLEAHRLNQTVLGAACYVPSAVLCAACCVRCPVPPASHLALGTKHRTWHSAPSTQH